MTKLAPCRRCKRHCGVSEAACPFCGARRLAIGASTVVLAALAVGWSGDAEADASSDAGAAPEAMVIDAGTADEKSAAELRREQMEAERQVVPLYGVPPSPRQGCW